MNGSPRALAPGQSAVLRVLLRLDRGGTTPVPTSEFQQALRRVMPSRTQFRFAVQMDPLVRKGLVRRHADGWISTWATQQLVAAAPAALGLAPSPALVPLPLPGFAGSESHNLINVDFNPPPPEDAQAGSSQATLLSQK